MTDLTVVLPAFPSDLYLHLLPSLDRNRVSTADLVTLDAVELAKRTQLPVLDLRRLCRHVVDALHQDLNLGSSNSSDIDNDQRVRGQQPNLIKPIFIDTLDTGLNTILGGGIPFGYVSEVTGESGAGKSQFLFTLLLSVQLIVHNATRRHAIYISTEGTLATSRLEQIVQEHPRLSTLPSGSQPSLSAIHVVHAKDLETQDHILQYGLYPAIRKFNAGLVVVDSIAANYRAEQESSAPKHLAQRQTQLAKLGQVLRKLAAEENIAIVVANQVSDRLEHVVTNQGASNLAFSSSPLGSSPSPMPPPSSAIQGMSSPETTLDHQQRFFSGWGDETIASEINLKTPALGLAWSNQISSRIALKMTAVADAGTGSDFSGGNLWRPRRRRRSMKVVFASWAPPLAEVEFEIRKEGVFSIGGFEDENDT